MEPDPPISHHERYVVRSGLSWLEKLAPDERHQLQRDESFPTPAADFALIFPYPQLGNVFIYESRARANYHALQARLERRFVNGLTFLVSYTFQKTLTDLDSSSAGVAFGAGAGLQTIKNIRAQLRPGGI